jgi:transcriptional regulator with XRE-family HTH domain
MSGTRTMANGTDWARWMRGLGGQVLRVREFLGFSQDQLARVAGVSQGAVSRLENGRSVATPLLVVTKISAALRTALSRVDPELLSDEARRIVQQGMNIPDAPGALLVTGLGEDHSVEELLSLYRGLSERQRRQLLVVVRAMARALSGEAGRDRDTGGPS